MPDPYASRNALPPLPKPKRRMDALKPIVPKGFITQEDWERAQLKKPWSERGRPQR